MALSLSTGLRDGILGTSALQALLDGGEINIWSGSAPASADDAATGVLLVTVGEGSSNGTDATLEFQTTITSGVMSKRSTTWDGIGLADGTAGYFRYCASTADAHGSSTTEVRVQGSVATSGAELNMSSTSITSAATTTVDTFDITMPAA